MPARLRQFWQALRESLWFVPSLFILASIGLALALVWFDSYSDWKGEEQFPLLFGAGAEGSRGMLTAIASSMLTVAGLTFTLTLSALSQASSQYSPRVLRNFMRDRFNQVIMGYFVGAFTYCLLVLRTIRGTDEVRFVPSISVLVGLVLALGGVVALILFIHHIAESLQVGTLVRTISRETNQAIRKLFPEVLGDPVEPAVRRQFLHDWAASVTWQSVASPKSGYLQEITAKEVLDWATRHDAVVRLESGIGEFVVAGTTLLRLHGKTPFKEAQIKDLTDQISIGKHRTSSQDVGFGIQQLVDIALKALSPGINDTTTAIMAVDYLGVILSTLAGREFPAAERTDGERLRVLVKAPDFDGYVRLGFDLVRINSKGNHALLRRLLRALADVAEPAKPARRAILREQAELILEQAENTLESTYEKQQVRALFRELAPQWSAHQRTAVESAKGDSAP